MSNLPGLNFMLGEDIDALRDAVHAFAQAEIAPRAAEIDRSDQFPMDLWEKMGALGVLGITVPEEYGGAHMGYLAHMIAMEEISRASASVGLSLQEIKQLVDMYDSPSDTAPQLEAFLSVLRSHRKQIELQLDDIRVTLEEIAQHEARCERLLEAANGAAGAPASGAKRAVRA